MREKLVLIEKNNHGGVRSRLKMELTIMYDINYIEDMRARAARYYEVKRYVSKRWKGLKVEIDFIHGVFSLIDPTSSKPKEVACYCILVDNNTLVFRKIRGVRCEEYPRMIFATPSDTGVSHVSEDTRTRVQFEEWTAAAVNLMIKAGVKPVEKGVKISEGILKDNIRRYLSLVFPGISFRVEPRTAPGVYLIDWEGSLTYKEVLTALSVFRGDVCEPSSEGAKEPSYQPNRFNRLFGQIEGVIL